MPASGPPPFKPDPGVVPARGAGRSHPAIWASPVFAEFPIPGLISNSGIAAGPDGNLWFNGTGSSGTIATINPTTHVITEIPLQTADDSVNAITAGPDGNIWFTGN